MWTVSSQHRVKAGWPLILDILFVFSDIDSSDSPDNKLINAWPAMQSNAIRQQETDTEQKGGEGLRLSFIFDEQRKETPYEDTYWRAPTQSHRQKAETLKVNASKSTLMAAHTNIIDI